MEPGSAILYFNVTNRREQYAGSTTGTLVNLTLIWIFAGTSSTTNTPTSFSNRNDRDAIFLYRVCKYSGGFDVNANSLCQAFKKILTTD